MQNYESSPEGMSDLIYFAIRATRSTGEDRIHYLKQLKHLCKAELEYEKETMNKKSITSWFKKKS